MLVTVAIHVHAHAHHLQSNACQEVVDLNPSMTERNGDGEHDWRVFLEIVTAHTDQNWLHVNGLWLLKAHWDDPLNRELNFRRCMHMTAGCTYDIGPLLEAFLWYVPVL